MTRFSVGQAVIVNAMARVSRHEKVGVVTKLHPMWEHCYFVIFDDGYEDLTYESNMREVDSDQSATG